MDDIKERVIGRWTSLFRHLGIETGDGRHIACPICGTPGKHKPFRYDDMEGKGTWICNYCGAGDGWGLVMRKFGLTFSDAVDVIKPIVGSCEVGKIPEEVKASPENLRKLFETSVPIHDGDLVSFYLQNRSLSVYPSTLRICLQCWEPEKREKRLAMLAVFVDSQGHGLTIHRTYLDHFGCKAAIEEPRKLMPTLGRMAGGCVRLFPLAGDTLGVATGIETAIAAHELYNIPVWATLNDSLLESFEPPPGVKMLYVLGDNDKNFSGQAAAYRLAKRVSIKADTDIEVLVCIPERPGWDWNDVLKSKIKRGDVWAFTGGVIPRV